MKLGFLIPVALAMATPGLSAPAHATGAKALSTADHRELLTSCPASLLRDSKFRGSRLLRTEGFQHGDEFVNVSYFRLDRNRQCAMQTYPVTRPLDASDPMTKQEVYEHASRHAPNDRSSQAQAKSLTCNSRTQKVTVMAGKCGSNGARVGSAFFVSPHLAISGGAQLQDVSEACLVAEGYFMTTAYYDVHQLRKTGSGAHLMAGFSLVRPAPTQTGFLVISQTSPIYSHHASIEGVDGGQAGCQDGQINYDDRTFASFYAGSEMAPARQFFPGGPAYLSTSPSAPMGFHVDTTRLTNGINHDVYPTFKRFRSAEQLTLNQWISSSTPTTAQSIQINSPEFNAVVNANLPLNVNVNSGSAYSLELNGWPVGNPITNIPEGTHTLVAYQTGAPQFRHTIRFQARRMIVADSHEVDDTATQWKALKSNERKYHNFHKANDADWSAFGIDNGQILNVAMSGSAFGNCVLNLYIQPGYPGGTRQLVSTRSGSCASLNVSHVTPTSPTAHVYFVEAKLSGSYSGNNTDYNLLLTTARDPINPDSYETDDTREQWKPLYSGQPQLHNFHRAGDTDWTAFVVGPNAAVTVTATGTGAERSRIRLFRQATYPSSPVELIATSEGKNQLIVFDQYPNSGPNTVYYVEASAIWSGFYGNAAQYTLSVQAN